jgi:hypothetical protein
MNEADAAARRLEAQVGKRFVEVLREFVAAEVRRNVAPHEHSALPSNRRTKDRSAVVVLRGATR